MRYKSHRKHVNYLCRKSLKTFINLKCSQPNKCNGKDFWHTVRPLISDKSTKNSDQIILSEEGKIINNLESVSNILNEYYVNMAQKIGPPDMIKHGQSLKEIIKPHKDKECIKTIKDHMNSCKKFEFNLVSSNLVLKKLCNLNSKKSTGYDLTPPKLIKLGASLLSSPVAYLINKCIETSEFPEQLKRAEVSPIFKKNDTLDKRNYRPISILPCLSKIFEGVSVDQLTNYFDEILSPFMSGFRKNHNCQSVLLRFTENCRLNLENNQVYGSLLTDLSKAFDSLPHRLLISKLDAYGVSENSCILLASYFQERSQRVKLGTLKVNGWN